MKECMYKSGDVCQIRFLAKKIGILGQGLPSQAETVPGSELDRCKAVTVPEQEGCDSKVMLDSDSVMDKE